MIAIHVTTVLFVTIVVQIAAVCTTGWACWDAWLDRTYAHRKGWKNGRRVHARAALRREVVRMGELVLFVTISWLLLGRALEATVEPSAPAWVLLFLFAAGQALIAVNSVLDARARRHPLRAVIDDGS
jgi:hypothetical protein